MLDAAPTGPAAAADGATCYSASRAANSAGGGVTTDRFVAAGKDDHGTSKQKPHVT